MVPHDTTDRVLVRLDALASQGLDTAEFLWEMDSVLQRVLHHCALCVGTLDPGTTLVTGAHKFGDLADRSDHDREWGLLEYGLPEFTSFTTLSRAEVPAGSVSQSTNGDIHRSARTREFIQPYFGYGDELRWVARVGETSWGGVALFRSHEDKPFQSEDIALATQLSPIVGAVLRKGTLAQMSDLTRSDPRSPVVLIVDHNDSITQVTGIAAEQLPGVALPTGPPAFIGGLVAAARHFEQGRCPAPPHCCLRLADGHWVSANAAPMSRPDGSAGDIVVTLMDVGVSQIVQLVVSALGFSKRERDVFRLVLRGEATADIARYLHISSYTVQDHLKAIFDKASVHSRRELVSKVFFDHYGGP